MKKETIQKYNALKDNLQELGSVAVAFSGGVDSTFLLKTAQEVLGEKVVAITVRSLSFPEKEDEEAEAFCAAAGIERLVCTVDQLAVPGFRQNPPDRCYLCKKELFQQIITLAGERGFAYVAEGSNKDDEADYRPGMQAIKELGVKSPLREAGLFKQEIRELSKELGLPTWSKPSLACLATRFPYGDEITAEKLSMVEKGERFLFDNGFRQARVRIHGQLARIEILPEEFDKLIAISEQVNEVFKALGFHYVSMDLGGYRSGSMNEQLKIQGNAD